MAKLGTGRLVCEDVETNIPNVSASTTTTTPRRETIMCPPLMGWILQRLPARTARAHTTSLRTYRRGRALRRRPPASPRLPIQRRVVVPANEVLERRRPDPRGLAAHGDSNQRRPPPVSPAAKSRSGDRVPAAGLLIKLRVRTIWVR